MGMLFSSGDMRWKDWLIVLGVSAMVCLPLCGLFICCKATSSLKNLISASFIPKALNTVFEQVEYHQERHIPEELIDPLLVQRSWEQATGDDYVRANYRGSSVEFSDVLLTYKLGIGDDSENISVFRGLWLICSLLKGRFRLN